jgi:predicted HicB family RNase H-like nuclease
MNNLMEYKGYYGSVEYSHTDNVLYGKVIGINSLISYDGVCLKSLRRCFENAIDDYLIMCAEEDIIPEKEYRGKFNVRISPELHKTLVVYSSSHGQTLNSTVEEAIRQYVEK